jgi:hypothetical protein
MNSGCYLSTELDFSSKLRFSPAGSSNSEEPTAENFIVPTAPNGP